jgi:hypothetical protein
MRLGTAVPYAVTVASALVVAGCVVALDPARCSRPNAVLLYGAPVVLAAVVAVLGHDLLLVKPAGALTVASPSDTLGLALLAFVAVITAQLADPAEPRHILIEPGVGYWFCLE